MPDVEIIDENKENQAVLKEFKLVYNLIDPKSNSHISKQGDRQGRF